MNLFSYFATPKQVNSTFLSVEPSIIWLFALVAQGAEKVEISRKKLREEILERIKFIKTCVMARELCLLIRTQRAVLEPQDVKEICQYISELCAKEGCNEPSELCAKAAAIVVENEEKYIDLCAQSCSKCGEARRPHQTKKETYVT